MVGSQNSGQNSVAPCAACKLLRRRCVPDCPFSPYFSPHEPHKFASVHKIFGASNVSKMLMDIPENQRYEAALSLVYEANARIRDPVYGCVGTISALQQQAQALKAELMVVRAEIVRIRRYRDRKSPLASSEGTASGAATATSGPSPDSPPPSKAPSAMLASQAAAAASWRLVNYTSSAAANNLHASSPITASFLTSQIMMNSVAGALSNHHVKADGGYSNMNNSLNSW